MPILAEGESVPIQGSSRSPYILKNVGGVYSCSCPAWRNQSLPIDRRTCKHLRQYCGEQAEQHRIGQALAPPSPKVPAKATVPALLLAHAWDNEQDLTGWWMSEKLDGVRAYWNGEVFLSRQGNRFYAPAWFTASLPSTPLDGELWIGRKTFQQTVSIVRRQDAGEAWRNVRYVVFDAPMLDLPFERRAEQIFHLLERSGNQFAQGMVQVRCEGPDHLRMRLSSILAEGGEGLMLREPQSRYEACRSHTLLKVKQFQDAEAVVMEHLPGAGKHRGRLGALLVELPNGKRFSVGTGFSDAQRRQPPPIGSVITFRYQELTDGGLPRFPSFVRVRTDAASV